MESTQRPHQDSEPAAAPNAQSRPRTSPVRLLVAGLVTLALLPLNAQFLIQSETVYYAGFPTTISLFYHAVFVLFVLSLANSALVRWFPRLAIHPAELAVVYIGLCIGSSTASHDSMQLLAPMMCDGFYLATPENGWAENLLPDVPKWLTVNDPHSLRELHEGGARLDNPAVYGPWIKPSLWWTLFAVALHTGTYGMVSFFRKRWIEAERLTFPIVQLPMELMHRRGGFLRQPSLWIAMGIVIAIDLLNGMHVLNPQWPQIPTRGEAIPGFNLASTVVDAPWNAVTFLPLAFYPIIIGLGLLLPTELAFSCWFFFLFWKAEQIVVRALGLHAVLEFPYIEAQALGGYAGIAFFAIWVSRSYVRQALRSVFGRERVDLSREAMSYRTSLIVFLLSFGFLVVFSVVAGMQVLYALAFFVIYFVIAFSISRIRAEMGLPAHDLHFAGPTEILPDVLGTVNIPARTRVVSRMFYWFNRAYRSLHAPHQIEALKISEQTGLPARATTSVLMVGVVAGMIVAFWAILWCWAEFGASAKVVARGFGAEIFTQMNVDIMTPNQARTGPLMALIVGIVFMVSMLALKMRVPWLPIHPAGFAVSATWTMQYMWCPLLIAWAIKSLISRYGGGQAYRRLVPIAFGLILGDLVGGVFWSAWGIHTKQQIYSIFQ